MSSSDSAVFSEGGGNIISPPKKQISPSIRWCMTLNNPTEDELEQLSSISSQFCKFAIVSLEVGDAGTPHLQGYIEFKKKSRPKSVFQFTDRISWEKAKGTKFQNWTYCTKDGNIKLQIGEGFEPEYKIDLVLKPWQEKIVEIIKSEPDDRSIYWFWESEGGIGKTVFQKWCFQNFQNCIVLSGKAADMKNGVIQYMQKNDNRYPKLVFINLPRSCKGFMSYTGMEEIKDMFFYSGKYEGGMVCGRNPHVMVFANEPPDYDKMSANRWKVTEIVDE